MMKAVAIVDEKRAEVVERPVPELKPNEVLLRIERCMLCTWEQRVFLRLQPYPIPYIGGHEFAGTIAAVGSDLDPARYPIGKKATGRVIPFCGECPSCRRGAENMCETQDQANNFGGLAEYLAVPVNQLYMVGDDVPFERLAFAEPLGCVITCFDKLHIQLGDDVVIIGAGMMGMLNLLVAKHLGARVIVSEPDAAKRALAQKLGADAVVDPMQEDAVAFVRKETDGHGARAVINCVTFKSIIPQCMAMLAIKGTFLMFGKMFPDGKVEFDLNEIHDHEYVVTGTMSASVSAFQRSVNLLEKGILKPETLGLLHATFEKEQCQTAFEEAIRPETYRVAIHF